MTHCDNYHISLKQIKTCHKTYFEDRVESKIQKTYWEKSHCGMAIKFAQFLPFICVNLWNRKYIWFNFQRKTFFLQFQALIALSTARVQFDASSMWFCRIYLIRLINNFRFLAVEDNEISVFPKEQVKVVIENDDKQLLDESKNEVTVAPVASVDSVDSVDPAAPADPIATVASVDPVASVDSVTPVAPVDPEAPPENESIKKMFTPDQWPPQELKPLKVAETDRKPVEVLIPSSAPVNPPTNFVNKFKINDFDMPNYAVGVDQRCEYYYGRLYTI